MADPEDPNSNPTANQPEIDKIMDLLGDEEEKIQTSTPTSTSSLNYEAIKATLDRYKIEAFKGKDDNLERMVKELRLTLDRVDRGMLSKEMDKIFTTFIRIWSERRFFKAEIDSQAVINRFFQYWMYKRAKKVHLNKENLKALSQILSDDSPFYSLQYTSKSMTEMKTANEEVKSSNPILYIHIDDFAETSRIVYSPFFLDNVNAFCKLDGFSELIQLLEANSDNPDNSLFEIVEMCIPLRNYLSKDFKSQCFVGIIDQILELFKKYSNESLKSISQDDMEKFINCIEFLLEDIYTDKKQCDEIIQKFELDLALRFLHTSYIEKRVQGLNILISKVNLVNRSNFPCTWKRKAFQNRKDAWLTSDMYLKWLLDHDIFGLFFGETLHSEIVVKYYAVLSFLYSKDQLNEKHLELIWDCAINKHDAYRVNILKVLSTLALKVKPSHAKFLFDKVKSMELTEYCKFTLQLLKNINKNVCKGPASDQAAHEAGFGKEKEYNSDLKELGDLLSIRRLDVDPYGRPAKKTRSFSLGGDEKENTKTGKKRHNSPVATLRHHKGLDPTIEIGSLDVSNKKQDFFKDKSSLEPLLSDLVVKEEVKKEELKNEENNDEEVKIPDNLKVEPDKQSTDEEDKSKDKSSKDAQVDQQMEDAKDVPEEEKKTLPEDKVKEEDLPPKEKQIKEDLKEESLEVLWKL